ncbi:hypothetical protein LJC53_04870 [Bacteroidales bacterium OttesenSCG-928-C03]|nr:hypothetical protein [Bacteroidales bacterium OttesenSCG-928-C03]MDL2326135.1 hypothetical protein [Bacteroidales bacterium OttesenSCG-928-A14]
MPDKIRRSEALRLMETKEKSQGEPAYFSIQFYMKSGEMVSIPRTKSAGLRANMKEQRLRGVQPVDGSGNATGHIYPVCIDNVRTINGLQVII